MCVLCTRFMCVFQKFILRLLLYLLRQKNSYEICTSYIFYSYIFIYILHLFYISTKFYTSSCYKLLSLCCRHLGNDAVVIGGGFPINFSSVTFSYSNGQCRQAMPQHVPRFLAFNSVNTM